MKIPPTVKNAGNLIKKRILHVVAAENLAINRPQKPT